MKNFLTYLVALTSPLHAGELVPSQIPASAKWQLHADFDAMRGSETGKAIFDRIEADHGAKLRAFKRMFSLHPLEELHGVTLYGDGEPKRGVALINGTFDRAHIEDVVQAAEDYSSGTYAGFTIHSWKDKETKQHAAFASETLLVFSREEDLLRQALDVLKANAPAPADPLFAAEGGHPLIVASARLSEIKIPGNGARLIRMAKTLHLAANESAGRFSLRANVETDTAPHAERLRRMLDGVIAFAQSSDAKLEGLDLRADLTPTTDKPGLSVSLSLPVAEWLSLMEKAAAEKAGKKNR